MSKPDLTEMKEWQALAQHQKTIADTSMREWFQYLQAGEILLDYSRNRINDQTLSLLFNLANAQQLKQKIDTLFAGDKLNFTENRPALHMACRDTTHAPLLINGKNIADEISATQKKMQEFVSAIHEGKYKGSTGKAIQHIVNIGIGGSHLGPKMCTHALKEFAVSPLEIHFISSVDEDQLSTISQKISLEETVFIISSKSFSTIEPLTNANTLINILKNELGEKAVAQHFIAITANAEKAMEFGIPASNIFPMWDWVGGRYSIWSAIGLPLMLMIGSKQFTEFLQGAHEMDEHFRTREFSENMPVIMGMLGIWYVNFFGATAQAIAPYVNRLRYLIPYLQQAEMESNGKSVDKNNQPISYQTGSILFGEEGCDSQHSYLQLLHQGKHFIPVDFILSGNAGKSNNLAHENILLASCLSQAQALMRGKTEKEAYAELLKTHSEKEAVALAPHKMVEGNKPSNILFLDRINPRNLGALIALYEHKIFVQSVIWNINPFDQWGVELGKELLPSILNQVEKPEVKSTDAATTGLIQHLSAIRRKK